MAAIHARFTKQGVSFQIEAIKKEMALSFSDFGGSVAEFNMFVESMHRELEDPTGKKVGDMDKRSDLSKRTRYLNSFANTKLATMD